MSCDSCTYSCSAVATDVCPNSDLSGIGVIIGYTVNTGIVVVVIVVHYLLVFQPDKDPFSPDEDQTPQPHPRADFKPNPIDQSIIRFLHGNLGVRRRITKRVEDALLKCVLSSSDLQILTGLSILISGFAQLPCGISRYHWKILAYLAWLSSVSHFGCLSLLRSQLFHRPWERVWRVFFILVVTQLLIIALVPTGLADQGKYGSDHYQGVGYYGQPALCAFGEARATYRNSMPFNNMVYSIVILVAGLCVRLANLSKSVSGSIKAKIRRPCRKHIITALARVREWAGVRKAPLGMKRLLVYWPLLTCFLLVRLLVDLYVSMLGEVLWIVISFCWGLVQLVQTRNALDVGKSDWSFGQIVPMVLILAPLLTFGQFFFEANKDPRTSPVETSSLYPPTEPSEVRHNPTLSNAEYGIQDEPGNDFYCSTWYQMSIVIPIVVIIELAVYTLSIATRRESIFEDIDEFGILAAWLLACGFGSWICFVLFSLLLDYYQGNAPASPLRPAVSTRTRTLILVFYICVITLALVFILRIGPFTTEWLSGLSLAAFLVCCSPTAYVCIAVFAKLRRQPQQGGILNPSN